MRAYSLMKRYLLLLPLLLLMLIGSSHVQAQSNTLELESTFKGNQEQPRVLYIVPWQKIAAPDAFYRPLQSLVEESFELVDRDEFKRELSFHQRAIESSE